MRPASGATARRSRGRPGPVCSNAAHASACCRYAVMIGWRVEPPGEGSPLRLACSLSRRARRRVSGRGRYGPGSASTSTRSRARLTAISPRPISLHSRCTRESRSRPRRVAGTASQTSSAARMRSTACSSRSSVKPSFISTIARRSPSTSWIATASQPFTSPFTRKPPVSRKRFTVG